jgi:MFS family permease
MSPATDVGGGRRSLVPILVATVFLDLVGFGIVVPQLPLAAARFEDRGLIVGLLVATDSLLSFFLAPQWGRFSDRVGRRPVILVGLAASAVSYLLFGLAPSLAYSFSRG